MATILEVLQYHPDYKGQEWVWRNVAIEPTSQGELDQQIDGEHLFEWFDAAPKPTFADLDSRRTATDQVVLDNESPDTTNDEDVLGELLLRPNIHRKIVRRVVDFQPK